MILPSWLTLAYVCIALGVMRHNGAYTPDALVMVLVGAAALGVGGSGCVAARRLWHTPRLALEARYRARCPHHQRHAAACADVRTTRHI